MNTVSPGTILTEMQPADDPEATDLRDRDLPRPRRDAEDVTGAYLFLAGDDSRYVTGTDLRVDGGWLERCHATPRRQRLLRGVVPQRADTVSCCSSWNRSWRLPSTAISSSTSSSVFAAVVWIRKPTSFLGTSG